MISKGIDALVENLKKNKGITEAYKLLFEYRGMPFPNGDNSIPNDLFGSRIDSIKALAGVFKKNKHGVLPFMPLVVYYEKEGDEILYKWQFPNEPLISLSTQKNIVQTAIAGGEGIGSVKELISVDDWQINISGICLNEEENEYPYEQVSILQEINNVKGSLKVENPLLTLLGINHIVIKSLELLDMQGVQNAQAYKISAVSDGEIQLSL